MSLSLFFLDNIRTQVLISWLANRVLMCATDTAPPDPADTLRPQEREPGYRRSEILRFGTMATLLFIISMMALLLTVGSVRGETWYIDPDGTGNYYNLTSAMADTDYVTEGDVLMMAQGRYNESPVVNRTLTIIGQGAPGEVIIDGGRTGDSLFIEANGTRIANLTVVGSRLEWPFAAIHIRETEGVHLSSITLSESHTGLFLEGSLNTRIDDLRSHNNTHGVELLHTDLTKITESRIENNSIHGLILKGTSDTDIEGLLGSGQQEDVRLVGVDTHEIAYNSTIDRIVFEEGQGSFSQMNSLELRVTDHLGRYLANVSLNLTIDNLSVYRTTIFGGDDPVSDEMGAFPDMMVEYANFSVTGGSGIGMLQAELITTQGWHTQRSLNLSRPRNLTLVQPDLSPGVTLLAPANNSLMLENVTLEWVGFDPEGADLNYSLWWRLDMGAWSDLALGADTTANLTALPAGANVTWKVVVSDGNLTDTSAIRYFRVNEPPTVELLTPLEGQYLAQGPPQLSWQGNDTGSQELTYSLFFSLEGSLMTRLDQEPGSTSHTLVEATAGGNYSWMVVVSDGMESVSSTVGHFSLNAPPRAHIDEITPILAEWPANVTATGHGEDDGTIAGHQWRIHDLGVVANTSTVRLDNLTHGSHQFEYRVMDDEGLWSDWKHLVVKLYTKPVADAGSDYLAKVGETVFFDAASGSYDNDGWIAKWDWDFDGDGQSDWTETTSKGETLDSVLITYSYSQARKYQAVLTITDNEGYTATDARVVEIEAGETVSNNDDDDDDGFLSGVQVPLLMTVMVIISLLAPIVRRYRY